MAPSITRLYPGSPKIVSLMLGNLPLPHWLPQCQSSNRKDYVDGLVQDCSDSSAWAMELLQSCTKPSLCKWIIRIH